LAISAIGDFFRFSVLFVFVPRPRVSTPCFACLELSFEAAPTNPCPCRSSAAVATQEHCCHFGGTVVSIAGAMSASQKATRDAKAVRGEMHNVLALMRRFDRTFQIPPQSSAILKSFKILHDHMQSISTLATVPASTYLKPFLDAITDCISDEDGGCSTHAGGTDYYTAMEIAVHALASVNKFVLYGIINPDSRGISAAMQRISETLSCCVIAPSEADETDKKEKKFILLFKLLELTVCCLRSEVRILFCGVLVRPRHHGSDSWALHGIVGWPFPVRCQCVGLVSNLLPHQTP